MERWKPLHQEICDRASEIHARVIGIDLDAETLALLNQKIPGEELLCLDAHRLSDYVGDNLKFDLMVAGDVIEHLPNPGLFLTSCREALSTCGRIVLSTVNTCPIARYLKCLLNHVAVHDEHTA